MTNPYQSPVPDERPPKRRRSELMLLLIWLNSLEFPWWFVFYGAAGAVGGIALSIGLDGGFSLSRSVAIIDLLPVPGFFAGVALAIHLHRWKKWQDEWQRLVKENESLHDP